MKKTFNKPVSAVKHLLILFSSYIKACGSSQGNFLFLNMIQEHIVVIIADTRSKLMYKAFLVLVILFRVFPNDYLMKHDYASTWSNSLYS